MDYDPDYLEPRIAQKYRRTDEREDQAQQYFMDITDRLCEGKDLTVLDLCCGTGRYWWKLRNVKRLVGVDIAKPMLDIARTDPYKGGCDCEVELVESNVHDFDTDEKFDLIISYGSLNEATPLKDMEDKVKGWLKDGGTYYLSCACETEGGKYVNLNKWEYWVLTNGEIY